MSMRAFALSSLILAAGAVAAFAQFTVLDTAQDGAPEAAVAPVAPPPICGTSPITIAQMSWPSSILLSEIHARILRAQFDCTVQIVPGDLAATASSMGSTGQPSVAPEMWVGRIPDVWNGAMEGQQVRSAAPSFDSEVFESWYMPTQTAALFTVGPSGANLKEALPLLSPGEKVPFITCPADWACAIINKNLIAAHGLSELVEIIEPSNRFEMDKLIAEAVNKQSPFLFYYWQPNAVLAQLDFTRVDMGPYVEAAAKCLASRNCAEPQPSGFAPESVVIAVAEKMFTEAPVVAGYFQRATLPLSVMDNLLAQLNQPGATTEAVAARFLSEQATLWRGWVGPNSR